MTDTRNITYASFECDNVAANQALDASQLIFTPTPNPRTVPDEGTATSGNETICTDHMIFATWKSSTGWSAPELKPYGPLHLMPTASCLHYATECFEGMKVYRGHDGKLRLFRPHLNAARFRLSASRISVPAIDSEQLEKLIVALVSTDGPKWLPSSQPGSSLYLRPTIIGTQPYLGVQKSKEAMLFITMSFMSRLDTMQGGMRVVTSPADMVRAWTGGFGFAKIGANYGPSIVTLQDAWSQGFDQVLWLYGPQGEITEAGGSNFFLVWTREDGQKEVITAPLDNKLILDGVTRRSCIELARQKLADEFIVTARKYTIDEVIQAGAEGRLIESFSVGTAYFVCPVSHIKHRNHDIPIAMGPDGKCGKVTRLLKSWLEDIMYGRESHDWGRVVHEDG